VEAKLVEADAKVEAAEVGSALSNFRQEWRRARGLQVGGGDLSEKEKDLAKNGGSSSIE
jgi:hypothetical protein